MRTTVCRVDDPVTQSDPVYKAFVFVSEGGHFLETYAATAKSWEQAWDWVRKIKLDLMGLYQVEWLCCGQGCGKWNVQTIGKQSTMVTCPQCGHIQTINIRDGVMYNED